MIIKKPGKSGPLLSFSLIHVRHGTAVLTGGGFRERRTTKEVKVS